MDQAGIIRDLLTWLEGHLDQPLSLDVAAKAGYSKWHLQRMFKDVTGHAIGAYIRGTSFIKVCRVAPDRATNPRYCPVISLRFTANLHRAFKNSSR